MELTGDDNKKTTYDRGRRKRRRSSNGCNPVGISPLWRLAMRLFVALVLPTTPEFRHVSSFVVRTQINGRSTNRHHHWYLSTYHGRWNALPHSSDTVCGPRRRPRIGTGPLTMVASKTAYNDINVSSSSESNSYATIHDADTGASTAKSTPGLDMKSLGWGPHFAAQVERGASDDDSSQQQQQQRGSLIPVRITEVRSKSIHVLGPDGIDQLISLSKGQKIINDNPEKVVVAGDWILAEELSGTLGGESILENDGDDDHIPDSSSNTGVEPQSQSQLQSRDRTLRIHTILNRKSVIQRKAPGRKTRKKQLIAANLDTVFVVSSCNQDFNVARLERYIAMVLETERVEPVIVLTKKDLLDFDGDGDGNDEDDVNTDLDLDDNEDEDDDLDFEDFPDDEEDEDEFDEAEASSWLLDYYRSEAGSIAGESIDIPVVCLDARNGDEASALLAPWLGEGQTVAFVGSSGVGKSTLVNSLCGSERVATGAIHTDSGQGRHTTTRRQLHFLEGPAPAAGDGEDSTGGTRRGCCSILDTPGLRELQLVDTAQGLGLVFGDLVDLSRQCRFNDCTHRGEPGCAIEAALDEGSIDADRVARWEKLVAEDKANTRDVAEGRRVRDRNKKKQRQQQRSKRVAPPEDRDIRVQGRKTKR